MARLRMSGAVSPFSYMPSCTDTSVSLPSTWSGYTPGAGEIRILYGILVAEYLLNCFENRKLLGRHTLRMAATWNTVVFKG